MNFFKNLKNLVKISIRRRVFKFSSTVISVTRKFTRWNLLCTKENTFYFAQIIIFLEYKRANWIFLEISVWIMNCNVDECIINKQLFEILFHRSKTSYSSMEVYKYWWPLFILVSLTWLDASYVFISEIKEISDNQLSSFFILNVSFLLYFLERKENFKKFKT